MNRFFLVFFITMIALRPSFSQDYKPTISKLISLTLEKVLVTDKDIPDYGLIGDDKKVFISLESKSFFEEKAPTIRLLKDMFPKLDGRKLVLKTEEELQHCADKKGKIAYLKFGKIKILKNRQAFVEIAVHWANPKNSDEVLLSGGGYELMWLRDEQKGWKFQRVMRRWQS